MYRAATTKSSTWTNCLSCGADLPATGPLAQCPRCLLQLGLARDEAQERSIPIDFGDTDPAFEYELLERIGRGGMGLVYRARQRSLNRIVAIKMIAAGEFASPASLARFRREAETAAKLDHPNIVSIIEVGEQRSTPYLVMRFVEGASLAAHLQKYTLTAPSQESGPRQRRIARLLATIARAVDFAHRRGILHRDLKPSNILLDLQGNPHLTDFGIAKSMEDEGGLTQTAELLGTLNYMAPEQAAAKPIGRTADIYSLGAILYELLTSHAPFEGPKMDVLRQVLEEEPPHPRTLNPAIDSDLAIICMKCLDKQPFRRYQSAIEFAEDLERWERNEPILAREAGRLLRFQRWTVRNPAVATLLFSLSLGVAVSLYLLAAANEEKNRKSIALDILRTQSARQLQEIWASTSSAFPIKSETLAAMAGMEVTALTEVEDRLNIGLVSEGNPLARALSIAPVFRELENVMSLEDTHPVRFDLTLYKRHTSIFEDFLNGSLDLAQVNPREFLRARERIPDLQPLITLLPGPGSSGVIFTRKDTGATQLSDLSGKSLLLANVDGTLTFWAKANLVSSGLRASHFSKVRYLDQADDHLPDGTAIPGASLGSTFNPITPIEAVVAGWYDAALVREKRFREVAAENGLVALARFSDSGDLIVSRGDLPQELAQRFQSAFSSTATGRTAESFQENALHYRIASEDDYVDVLNRLAAEAEFDK